MVTSPAGATASAGLTVTLDDCVAHRTFTTTTDGSGIFAFNPLSANSAAIDQSKRIPEGTYWLTIGNTVFGDVEVTYDSTCTVPYNGGQQTVQCSQRTFVLSKRETNDPSTIYGMPAVYPLGYGCADVTGAAFYVCRAASSQAETLAVKHHTAKCNLGNTL